MNRAELRRAFDYMAIHIIAQMKPGNVGPGSVAYPPIPFEIQVRTIGQDAWASVSHYLHYKHETSFPPERLRDLYALSALFYLADVHFESLKAACVPPLQIEGAQAP